MKNMTTSLPEAVFEDIEKVAKSLKVAKNEVIMRSFQYWNKKRKQEGLIEAYKKMASDSESILLAESGIEDYKRNLESWEK